MGRKNILRDICMTTAPTSKSHIIERKEANKSYEFEKKEISGKPGRKMQNMAGMWKIKGNRTWK